MILQLWNLAGDGLTKPESHMPATLTNSAHNSDRRARHFHRKVEMEADVASSRFQGVDKSSTAYKLLSSMGWEEGQGLVCIAFHISSAGTIVALQDLCKAMIEICRQRNKHPFPVKLASTSSETMQIRTFPVIKGCECSSGRGKGQTTGRNVSCMCRVHRSRVLPHMSGSNGKQMPVASVL